jgi:hypothetical protein
MRSKTPARTTSVTAQDFVFPLPPEVIGHPEAVPPKVGDHKGPPEQGPFRSRSNSVSRFQHRHTLWPNDSTPAELFPRLYTELHFFQVIPKRRIQQRGAPLSTISRRPWFKTPPAKSVTTSRTISRPSIFLPSITSPPPSLLTRRAFRPALILCSKGISWVSRSHLEMLRQNEQPMTTGQLITFASPQFSKFRTRDQRQSDKSGAWGSRPIHTDVREGIASAASVISSNSESERHSERQSLADHGDSTQRCIWGISRVNGSSHHSRLPGTIPYRQDSKVS